MTTVSSGMPAIGRRQRIRQMVPKRSEIDATAFLTLYLVLLVGIPSRLIFKPLGAVGTPANVMGLIALAWWTNSRLVPTLGISGRWQPMRFMAYLFAAALTCGFAAAMARPLPEIESSAAYRGMLAMASGIGILLVAADGIRDRARFDVLIRRFHKAAVFLAVIGILQFFIAFDITRFYRIPGLEANSDLSFITTRSAFRRVAGTTIHPIEYGVVMALALPVALHYAFESTDRRRWRQIEAGLIAMAIPLSVSRSAFLGIAVAFIVLLAGWRGRRRMQAIFGAMFFAVLMRLLVPGLLGTIKSLFTNFNSDPSITGRTDDYKVVGRFITSQPFFGRGFGTFVPDRFFILDNQYLLSIVEIGFVGFGVLLMAQVVAFGCARGARLRSDDHRSRDLAQSLAASIGVLMFSFITFDALSFPMITGFFFFMLGICGAMWRIARDAAPAGARIPTWLRDDAAHTTVDLVTL